MEDLDFCFCSCMSIDDENEVFVFWGFVDDDMVIEVSFVVVDGLLFKKRRLEFLIEKVLKWQKKLVDVLDVKICYVELLYGDCEDIEDIDIDEDFSSRVEIFVVFLSKVFRMEMKVKKKIKKELQEE